MNHYKLKLILAFFILIFSSVGFSETRTVHHKFINDTPYEIYVGVRQQFQYPIDGCLGPIASGEIKECDEPLEKSNTIFVIELIKKINPASEFMGSLRVNTLNYNALLFTWTIKLDKKNDLEAIVKLENQTPKWINQSIVSQ